MGQVVGPNDRTISVFDPVFTRSPKNRVARPRYNWPVGHSTYGPFLLELVGQGARSASH